MPAGRPTSWSEAVEQQAIEYIENYAEHGHPLPSVVGMAVVLNVAKSTLYKWVEDKRGNFPDTLERCNDFQEMKLLHGGLLSDFNPTITKLALANHGYHDKQDTEHTGKDGAAIDHTWTVKVVTTRQGGG